MPPIESGRRRFADIGGLEGKLKIMPHLLAINESPGMIYVILVRQFVEVLLADQLSHQLAVNIRNNNIVRVLVPIVRHQKDIVIGTADGHDLTVPVLRGEITDQPDQSLGLLRVRVDPIINQTGPIGGP